MAGKYDFWVDITSPPQVFFFTPIIKELVKKGYSVYVTVRDRGETVALAKKYLSNFSITGSDSPHSILKISKTVARTLALSLKVPDYDICLCSELPMGVAVSKIKRRRSLIFLDNDLKVYEPGMFQKLEVKVKTLSNYVIVPKVAVKSFGKVVPEEKIIHYDGYKEHISISIFRPDPSELNNIPFSEFVVIRPEALSAMYVREKKSIVPDLIKRFYRENVNVVYLPRKGDFEYLSKSFIKKYDNIFIPDGAVDGLNISYYAKAVLTGSGTMAREASLLGTTAVSFFPSKKLLAVDIDLISKKRLFHSRDVNEIINHVLSNWNKKRLPEFDVCKKIVKNLTEEITNHLDGA
ncbi:DUF354 domain-containing protein [Geoglobus acetivorans]|uniref:DUF354 domain-containing protein n=1 Tax=Geoglobus acetivorans TaxID=565033 RepID=A0ABZ3H452_GEOAI|nr:DUF354 domain-containing protein [Geoglobus acetivorans]